MSKTSLVLPMKSTRLTTNPLPLLPRVSVPNVPVFAGTTRTRFNMCAWCRYTRGRFERTHGDVLDGHNTVFALCGLSCLHFYQEGNIQPFLEGQRLETAHIMEGTCYVHVYVYVHVFVCVYICIYTMF